MIYDGFSAYESHEIAINAESGSLKIHISKISPPDSILINSKEPHQHQ